MDISTVLVTLLVVVLFYALYRKGDVRAGAKLGPISLFFEAKESKTPANQQATSRPQLKAPPPA